jgi:hypothetical protein
VIWLALAVAVVFLICRWRGLGNTSGLFVSAFLVCLSPMAYTIASLHLEHRALMAEIQRIHASRPDTRALREAMAQYLEEQQIDDIDPRRALKPVRQKDRQGYQVAYVRRRPVYANLSMEVDFDSFVSTAGVSAHAGTGI